jgi:hypothetical protein
MKTLTLLTLSLLVFVKIQAQTIELQFNKSSYNGGYNISCNGATDGSITMIVIGGTSPYTYLWANGATTKNLTSLVAGDYGVIVTDYNGVTATGGVTLLQPDALDAIMHLSQFEGGYNISESGADDGWIKVEIRGGTPPYRYLWSNGAESDNIDRLTAGNYSVTVTDMNNCIKIVNTTLTEPIPLTITSITSPVNSGGYNISCFEGEDGSATVNVTGGVPPYRYEWRHGSGENPVYELSAKQYTVFVFDENGAEQSASITLTQPDPLEVSLAVSIYGKYNISCYNCANGYINSTVTGGIPPYTYQWIYQEIPFAVTQNIDNLDEGDYKLIVTDALNCRFESNVVRLTEAPKDDWSMTGNTDTDPSIHYMGTSDATDFVMRTNGQEALRITSDGDVKVAGLAGDGGMVYVDENGTLRSNAVSDPGNSCTNAPPDPMWHINNGSSLIYTCPPTKVSIGSPVLSGFPGMSEIFSVAGDANFWGNLALSNTTGFAFMLNRLNTGNAKNQIVFAQNSVAKWSIGNDYYENSGHNFFLYDNHNSKLKVKIEDNFINLNGNLKILDEYGDNALEFLSNNGIPTRRGISIGDNTPGSNNNDGSFNFFIHKYQDNAAFNFIVNDEFNLDLINIMTIKETGQVGINTSYIPADYKLAVDGKIIFTEALVKAYAGWPDYVFAKDYKLRSIKEYENFIKQNSHLPGMPSAKEIEEANGFEVGAMYQKLLQITEEQALYIIELNKRLESLENELKLNKETK